MNEDVIQFGEANNLIGVVTAPEPDLCDENKPVFIFLNAGFIHRVGFSRVHVDISRHLASMGFFSFRLDSSGIGDSPSHGGHLQIEQQWVDETRQAMDLLQKRTGSEKFILVGNCSGADISFRTAYQDKRVVSAVMINPMASRIMLRYYIRLVFFMPSVWTRLFKGKLKFRETFKLFTQKEPGQNEPDLSEEKESERVDVNKQIAAGMKTLAQRGCRLFMIHCEWDPHLCFYKGVYKKQLANEVKSEQVKVAVIKGMNHDFFLVRGLQELSDLIKKWAVQMENMVSGS